MRKLLLVVGLAVVQVLPAMPQGLRLGLRKTSATFLLQSTDLTYVGAFKLPSAGATDTFDSSRGELTFYQDAVQGATLFIAGLKSTGGASPMLGTLAQIKVPATINNPNVVGLGGLTTGTAVQNFADTSDGLVPAALEAAGQISVVAYQDMIIGTGALDYDANCTHPNNAWVTTTAFSGTATGMYHWSTSLNARYLGGGFMTLVPSAWQSQFGRPVVSGNGPMSIIGCASSGPSLHTIDADTLITQPATTNGIASTPLVYYPYSVGNQHARLGVWDYGLLAQNQTVDGVQVPYITVTDPHHGGATQYTINYNNSAVRITGVVFPDNTNSVLFTGQMGLGIYCYGSGVNSNPPSPPVDGADGTGTGASTSSNGLTITLPNTNVSGFVGAFIHLTGETQPSHYIDGGGHAGTAKITAQANSGTPSANVTVDYAFTGNLTGKAWSVGNRNCYDPDSLFVKGDHAWPYSLFVWAYDAADLLLVKAGTKQPYEIAPYNGWVMTLFGDGTGKRVLGAGWDPATRRLYLGLQQGESGVNPLIHIFTVASPPMPSPWPEPFAFFTQGVRR